MVASLFTFRQLPTIAALLAEDGASLETTLQEAGICEPSNQGEITAEVLTVNGGPALALSIDGELDTVATFVIEDGVVTGLYLLRNPEKLSRLGQVVDLTR